MVVVPESYFKKEINVKLTNQEIDIIVESLVREPHNIYVFLKYDKLIKKLKQNDKRIFRNFR